MWESSGGEITVVPDSRYVHGLNPILLEVWGVTFWYYGLAYALGFLGSHLWVLWRRGGLGLPVREVWNLSILIAISGLIGGRVFDIVVYEWDYFTSQPSAILTIWRGGMASHGVILGAVLGISLFCCLHGRNFLRIADELVIPAAMFLGLGRIGNHINGEIYGYVTDVWWAVRFPYADGFRHPVALYDGMKNFLMIPLLLLVKRTTQPGEGRLLAHFVFWYGFLRLLVDYFRDYGSEFLGVGTGQYYNLLMAAAGFGMIVWLSRTSPKSSQDAQGLRESLQSLPSVSGDEIRSSIDAGLWLRAAILAALLFLCLTISSGWSQEGLRHLAARGGA